MNSNVYPMSNPVPAPMPQTVANRQVKYAKADIARLKRQIRVEEQRIALQVLRTHLEAQLEELRTK